LFELILFSETTGRIPTGPVGRIPTTIRNCSYLVTV